MTHVRSLSLVFSCVAAASILMACDSQPSPPAAPQPDAAIDAAPAAASATGEAAVDDGNAVSFHARGNEPFWSVKVNGATLVYSTPENQPGLELGATRTDTATDIAFRGKDGDRDFVLIITPGRCDDTMSDETFDYTATFSYGERQMTGCASSGE